MERTPDFSAIPVIDLSRCYDPSTRPELLADLRHMLTDVGFLYLINHRLSDVTNAIIDILPQLFALSPEQKCEVALINSPHFLGYSGEATETTAGQPDMREQFEFATASSDVWEDGGRKGPLFQRLQGPNQWPRVSSKIRGAITSYISSLSDLSITFLSLVAEALNLSPDSFDHFLSNFNRLKLIRYPPPNSTRDTKTQGVGPHKDSSGWFTFLLQASGPDVKGLQVLNNNGDWIDVAPIEGSLVVNIGQAFEVVTHGVCKATVHRVILDRLREGRYSAAFFQGIRGSLTRTEATETLRHHFEGWDAKGKPAAIAAQDVESPFLRGKYETWGESQLRTKIRSHQDVGRRWYQEVWDGYMEDV